MDPCPLQPIPRAPRYFRGVAQLHGLITPVLDLRLFLDQGDSCESGQLLLLAPSAGQLALWVDSVERIMLATESSPAVDEPGLFTARVQLEAGAEVRLLHIPELVARVTAALAGR
jgi:chemotaxis signal transduction protein